MMRYLSVTEFATKHQRPRPTVKRWCQAGLIHGVMKVGRQFAIPAHALPPEPKRGRPSLHDDEARTAVMRLDVPE